jgi:hypothetical protein
MYLIDSWAQSYTGFTRLKVLQEWAVVSYVLYKMNFF